MRSTAVAMAARSPSHRAFLKHLDDLEVATTDPEGLATQLYADGLIDRLALQRANPAEGTQLERSRKVLQTLDAKLQTNTGGFDVFLSILDRDPTMVDMCRKLRDTRGMYSCATDIHVIVDTAYTPQYMHKQSLFHS